MIKPIGSRVKYIGPVGPLSGLNGLVELHRNDGRELFVSFGGTQGTVWLSDAMVIQVKDTKPTTVGTCSDAVKAPSHYMLFDNIESIEVIARSMTVEMFKGFCFGNVLKYRLRAGKKSDLANMDQDLRKAEFYKELFEKHKEKCYA